MMTRECASCSPVFKDTHPGEFDLVILGGDVDTNEIDEMNK